MKRRSLLRAMTGMAAASALPSLPVMLTAVKDVKATSPAPQLIPRFHDGRDWFFEKRFGLFLHWGLYAIPAWHEQYQWRARVPRDRVCEAGRQWNPVKYDPEAWLDLARKRA